MNLLEVRDLTVDFLTDEGVLRAVDHISFDLSEGEVLGIVGESGSGKSVSCLALMGLLPSPSVRMTAGSVLFRGQDLLRFSEPQMRSVRGKDISMIFQDPFTSLNPYLRISTQMMEVLECHSNLTRAEAKKRCIEVLSQLHIPEPELRFQSYPHQLSGGLKQRVMIGMSLLLRPKILIADEPTTALDVTIQAQILDLLREANEKFGTAIILITHDLGVVSGLCHRVHVMYAGRMCETGTADDIFYHTRHPYTQVLLNSLPSAQSRLGARLVPIPGAPPDLTMQGDFCAFYPRCSLAQKICSEKRPAITQAGDGHSFECNFPVKEGRP